MRLTVEVSSLWLGPAWARPRSPSSPDHGDTHSFHDRDWGHLAHASLRELTTNSRFGAMMQWLQEGVEPVMEPSTADLDRRKSNLEKQWRRRDRRCFLKHVAPSLERYSGPDSPSRPHLRSAATRVGSVPSSQRNKIARLRRTSSCPEAVVRPVPLPRGRSPDVLDNVPCNSLHIVSEMRFVRRTLLGRRHKWCPSIESIQPRSVRMERPSCVLGSTTRVWNKYYACIQPRKSRAYADVWGGVSGSDLSESSLRDVCLVTSLRALEVPVQCHVSGPFRALTHGNVWLREFSKCLRSCSRPDGKPGKYILWCGKSSDGIGHFRAVVVTDEDCMVHDGELKYTVTDLASLEDNQVCWFRLTKSISHEQSQRIAVNHALALRLRSQRLRTEQSMRQAPDLSSLTQAQRLRVSKNRASALRTRGANLIRPIPPSHWTFPSLPAEPHNWISFDVELPEITWLSTLNAHVRDRRLQFFPTTHTYYVDGEPTLGSVTGLIHTFTEAFDENAVIERMMAGGHWPREGYLRLPVCGRVLAKLEGMPEAGALVKLLKDPIPDETAIASAARAVACHGPISVLAIMDLSLTPSEIKRKWEENRTTAANQGYFISCFLPVIPRLTRFPL